VQRITIYNSQTEFILKKINRADQPDILSFLLYLFINYAGEGFMKNKRNFNGERKLTRTAASLRLAVEVVKSGNQGTIQKSAHAIRTLAEFVEQEYGLKNLARLQPEQMENFANDLLEKVDNSEISQSHATNIISSLNSIFNHYYRDDLKISAKEHGLNRGEHFKNIDKSIAYEVHEKFSDFLAEKFKSEGDIRYEALKLQIELQRELGLRFKESALFSEQALRRNGEINIDKGTKGGQLRTLQSNEKQKELIREIKDFRKNHNFSKSLIPDSMNFKQWQNFAYHTVKTFNETYNQKYNFHGERHFYAQLRYKQLTGHEPPVKSNERIPVKEEKASMADYEARMRISEELGHHRLDITNHYLGKS
jgi:hypothetical protein